MEKKGQSLTAEIEAKEEKSGAISHSQNLGENPQGSIPS